MTTNDHTPNANSIFNMDFEFGILAACCTACLFDLFVPRWDFLMSYTAVRVFGCVLSLPLVSIFKIQLKEKNDKNHNEFF